MDNGPKGVSTVKMIMINTRDKTGDKEKPGRREAPVKDPDGAKDPYGTRKKYIRTNPPI
jgi:hypothetical protein